MTPTKRIPQAPREPLPELAEFLEPFRVQFRRRESQVAMERYLTGLLTEHPNKNCERLAEVIPGASEQQLQGLLTQMVWDHESLNQQRVARMQALKTEGDGALIFDDTGFGKQGSSSVGVARQPAMISATFCASGPAPIWERVCREISRACRIPNPGEDR